MISFACPGCAHNLRVKDDLAGRRGKCPRCKKLVLVPGVAVSANSLTDALTIAPQAPASSLKQLADSASMLSLSECDTQSSGKSSGTVDRSLVDFLASAQKADELGRLGPYRILKVLGHGGMGVVYQAEDPQLQRLVAIKAMLPTLAASASARERFLREARAAAAIEHDNIIAILQVGEDRGVPFLAMPFLKGESLEDRLRREGALPLTEVLRICRESAEGLAAAHARGMIHRDIKPANLWLEGERGRVKVLDFGLARSVGSESNLTQQGAIMGTPSYMAPEQAGGKVDARADLFSLGVVFYRALTGQLPFKGTDSVSTLIAVATHDPTPPSQIMRDVPSDLCDLVMHLLAKKPSDRVTSARDLIRALRALEETPIPSAASRPRAAPTAGKSTVVLDAVEIEDVPSRQRARKKQRKKDGLPPWIWALTGAGGVVVVLAAFLVAGVFKNKNKETSYGADVAKATPGADIAKTSPGADAANDTPQKEKTDAKANATPPAQLPAQPSIVRKTKTPRPRPQHDSEPDPERDDDKGPLPGELETAQRQGVPVGREVWHRKVPFPTQVKITPDGKSAILVVINPWRILLWDLERARQVMQYDARGSGVAILGTTGSIAVLEQDRDGSCIKTFDIKSGVRIKVFALPRAIYGHLVPSADGSLLAFSVQDHKRVNGIVVKQANGLPEKGDCSVHIFDVASGKDLHTLVHSCKFAGPALTFSADAKKLVGVGSPGPNGKMYVWDVKTGALIQEEPVPNYNFVSGVAMVDDRRVLFCPNDDIYLWDLKTHEAVGRLSGHKPYLHELFVIGDFAVSAGGGASQGPNGERSDASVRVWNLRTMQEVQRCLGHQRGVLSLAVTPDGQRAVSTSMYDHTLRLWDLSKVIPKPK